MPWERHFIKPIAPGRGAGDSPFIPASIDGDILCHRDPPAPLQGAHVHSARKPRPSALRPQAWAMLGRPVGPNRSRLPVGPRHRGPTGRAPHLNPTPIGPGHFRPVGPRHRTGQWPATIFGRSSYLRPAFVRSLDLLMRLTKKTALVVLLLLLLGAMAILLRFTRTSLPWENEPSTGSSITNRINSLQAPEDEIDRTVWAKEMLAQRCGRTFESLWNSINASTNKLSVAANFPFGKIVLPHWAATEHLAHGIEMRVGDGPGEMLSPAQWRQQIQNLSNDRWQLENIEFRHNRFEVDTNGAPSQSGFYFSAHLTSPGSQQRAMLEGDLLVNWENLGPGDTPATVKRIDATHLQLKTRTGEPFFRKILDESFSPTPKAPVIDPLIVYDLDGDGFPEILLPAINQVYRRREPEHYEPEPLCRYP